MDLEGSDLDDDVIPLPRRVVRLPLELRPPAGFQPENAATWPELAGRLEVIGGRLYFMPPCGDVQQSVAASVAAVLESWSGDHPQFVVGANEAGMLLDGDVRGADAAVWRRGDLGSWTGGFRRTAPVLAVEIAGQDEEERELREKAAWYLGHGVSTVWLVLPATREVLVMRRGGETRYGRGARLPEDPELPGLAPPVDRFFRQLA